MKKKVWTLKEIEFMKQNQYTLSINEISIVLNRSYRSVKSQSERCGIKLMSQSYKNFYVQKYYFYNRHDEVIAYGTVEQIAKKLGKRFETVKNYIYRSYEEKNNLRSRIVPVGDDII